MTDAREIYRLHAQQYDALVSREDHAGNLLAAIRDRVQLEGAEVVELGAGTGRITALLAPHVRSLRAFDLEPAMLEVARQKLSELQARNWQLESRTTRRCPSPRAARISRLQAGATGTRPSGIPAAGANPSRRPSLR